jgi:hypothetical protein
MHFLCFLCWKELRNEPVHISAAKLLEALGCHALSGNVPAHVAWQGIGLLNNEPLVVSKNRQPYLYAREIYVYRERRRKTPANRTQH